MTYKELLVIISLSAAACALPTSGVSDHGTTRRTEHNDFVGENALQGPAQESSVVRSTPVSRPDTAPTQQGRRAVWPSTDWEKRRHTITRIVHFIPKIVRKVTNKIPEEFKACIDGHDLCTGRKNNTEELVRQQEEIRQHTDLQQQSMHQYLIRDQQNFDNLLSPLMHLSEQGNEQSPTIQSS